jgi:two-component system, OmpR family, sensor histidine kinase KdpD
MRSALLSTVSHDLRTPLAAITGAATTLRDGQARLTAEQRVEMLDAICEEAARMERLVGNLFDMTRVQAGALQVKRDGCPSRRSSGRPSAASMPRLEECPSQFGFPA